MRAGDTVVARLGGARRHARRMVDLVRYGAAGAPVSIGLLATIWVLGLLTSSVLHGPTRYLARHVGVGIAPLEHWRVWTVLTAGLWEPGLVWYLVTTVLVFFAAAPVERRIGSRRFAVAALTTQILGSILGAAVATAARLIDQNWGFRLHASIGLGATTWIFGAVAVATSEMGTLWRRRIRVGLLVLTITLALFGGQLQDVIHLAAVAVGLALGPRIVGRSARGPRITGTRREGRVLVAIVVAATSVGTILAALSPLAVGPLAVLRELFRGVPVTAPEVRELCEESLADPACRRGLLELRLSGLGPTLLSLMPTLFLLVLSDGLRRGRRFAWLAAVCAQVALLVLSMLNFVVRFGGSRSAESLFDGLESPNFYRILAPFLTPLAILILLLATKRFFDVSAPVGTYRRLGIQMCALTAGLWVLYLLGGLWARHRFDPEPTAAMLLADFPERLIPPVYLQWLYPRLLPNDWASTLLYEWPGVVFWGAACVLVAATFLRPALDGHTDAAERARDLLRHGTGSPLSWMTTWQGHEYWFSDDGSSYVAFRVISGVALTTGDPVGPPERLRENVAEFAEYAAANGWIPCFYSVTGDVRDVTDALGWSDLRVAEETVLDLEGLAFTGKRFQDVRTAINRAKKAGITAEWISFPTAPLGVKEQIMAISEEWVADKGMPEMGFTLGGLRELDDPDVRCLIAVDEHRTVHGITSWLPVYRDGRVVGWTLDFMRRRSEGFRPTIEFLIASAAQALAAEGAEFASLSGAPLATVDRPDQAGDDSANTADRASMSDVLDSLLDLLGRTLEPVYGFRSLLAFKSKFQPHYLPMYMTFADPAALPSIGNAIGRAYLPDMSLGQGVSLIRKLLRW